MTSALATNAQAQSAEAQARFDDGVRLMKAGKTEEACAAFETSNRLEPRAGTLLRLGQCREANHQLASAWSAYQDALTKATDPKKKTFATQRVKALESRLSHLRLNVKARESGLAITRDEKPIDAGLWNVAVPVDGGAYTISASAPGRIAWKTTVTVPEEGKDVDVDVPALALDGDKSTKPPPDDRTTDATPDVTAPPEDTAPQGTFTGRRKAAVAVLGVGVVATAVGVALGVSSNHNRDRAYELCPDPATPCANAADASTAIHTAHDRAFQADAAFAVGAVAATVAGVLWFTGAPERRLRVDASVSSRGAGIALTGAF